MNRRHFGLVLVAGLALAGLAAHTTATLMPLARAEGPTAKVILAGGCFWCLEHDMLALPGVVDAVSGYSGGSRPMPTYDNYHDVDAANPKPHVEVVEVTYDTAKLSFATVLDYYFRHVDPTDDGGQFCDRGPAYRPVVFFGNADEQALAEAKAKEVSGLIKEPVKVSIEPAQTFWPAEDYHQEYAEKNSIKYKYYRWNCGRDQRVEELWRSAQN